MAARLVAAAAAREQTGKRVPMAQRVLLARLAADFRPAVPPEDAARVPGLYPEVAPSPDGRWLALFVPTASGAEILLVDRTTLKTIRLAGEEFNTTGHRPGGRRRHRPPVIREAGFWPDR